MCSQDLGLLNKLEEICELGNLLETSHPNVKISLRFHHWKEKIMWADYERSCDKPDSQYGFDEQDVKDLFFFSEYWLAPCLKTLKYQNRLPNSMQKRKSHELHTTFPPRPPPNTEFNGATFFLPGDLDSFLSPSYSEDVHFQFMQQVPTSKYQLDFEVEKVFLQSLYNTDPDPYQANGPGLAQAYMPLQKPSKPRKQENRQLYSIANNVLKTSFLQEHDVSAKSALGSHVKGLTITKLCNSLKRIKELIGMAKLGFVFSLVTLHAFPLQKDSMKHNSQRDIQNLNGLYPDANKKHPETNKFYNCKQYQEHCSQQVKKLRKNKHFLHLSAEEEDFAHPAFEEAVHILAFDRGLAGYRLEDFKEGMPHPVLALAALLVLCEIFLYNQLEEKINRKHVGVKFSAIGQNVLDYERYLIILKKVMKEQPAITRLFVGVGP
ncbi:hypothetical protein GGX14DRAFT_387398 [Mycena pura]|uniref:DUF6532 domain-containing protein n=1 Tax=Mycena pura TaxID=153505 RepID=A0AAD7E1A4_9AGAR|nr:hypothetical protein GGX14DRAFT_387398 [Mycena pura]